MFGRSHEVFSRRPREALFSAELVSAPVLVLGAEEDGSVTVDEVHLTARAYGTTATIFPRMGHNMMQDVGWITVADHICQWLGGRGL
jgi:pimeloyl-ACP methyl ester carboxylesterase